MSGEINWKMKYNELKSKYMNAVDMAFRLGVEEGLKQGQLDSANQQLAQAQSQVQAQGAPGADPAGKPNNNGASGTPDQGAAAPDKSGAPSVQPPPVEGASPAGGAPMKESEHPDGSELDQHIATLEGMLKKHETDEGFDASALSAEIGKLRKFQSELKLQSELKKSQMAISGIAKALHMPQFKFGVQAQHNLSSSAKAAVTMQQEIVQDVFKKWEEEEKKAGKDILSTLNIEGIVKG